MNKNQQTLIFIGIGVMIVIGALMLCGVLYVGMIGPMIAEARATDTPIPTATFTPSLTPSSTSTPTETPPPTLTATPVDTSTPVPTATNTSPPPPPPTAVPPTKTPAPPTNTPPPAVVPGQAHGLTDLGLRLDPDKASFNPGEQIWFRFTIKNSSGQPIPYGYLGPTVFATDGTWLFNKPSWSNEVLQPGQLLEWHDWLAINTSGTYDLRLAICYSQMSVCDSGNGEWEILSNPVRMKIN